MMAKKPLKRGKIVEEQESIMLIAEDGKAYKVTKSVANFWKMCDGSKSLEELVNSLAEKFNVKPEVVKPRVLEVVDSLQKVNLLELV